MASKTVSIGVKFEDEGNGIKKLTLETGALRDVFKGVVKEAETAKGRFLSFASASIGIDAIKNSLSELQNITKKLTDAYAVQVEAETKLETVMRQRMGATQEQIQSIKDLCSAQQQLGVIGDEIQLAGAQQLTTFLTQRSALETLIPAMNNLVAQQKGLNATSGDAVNIGNLLGKAMQGQTAALRRVGITFSEAEERAVKFGTEQERAAALAKIITNNVGEMNAELAKTEPGKMKQIANNTGDLQEKLGQMSQKLMPGITLLNQMVMAGTNIKKVTMAFNALLSVLRNVTNAVRASSPPIKMFGGAWTASATMAKAAAITIKGAIWTIKTAIISTGVGILIWGIGEGLAFIVEKLNGVSSAAKDAGDALDEVAQAQQAEAQQLKDVRAQLAIHISEIEEFKGSKEQERAKIEELNSTYGKQMGYFASLNDWYKALTKNSEAYCKQMVAEIRARKIAEEIASLDEQIDKQEKIPKIPAKIPIKARGAKPMDLPGAPKKGADGFEIPNADNYNKAFDAMTAAMKAKRDAKQKEMAELLKSAAVAMPVMGSSTQPNLSSSRSGRAKSVEPTAPKGSIADLKNRIGDIDKKISFSLDPEEIAKLTLQKQALEKQIGDMEVAARIIVERPKMQGVEEELKRRPLELDVKVNTEGLKDGLKDIPAEFKDINKDSKQLGKNLSGLGDICRSAGDAFSSMGNAFESPELNIAGTISQAIANILLSFGQAMTKTMSPWEWAAFGLAGLAQVTAMIAQVKSIGKFADGGIAYGPTLGLFGEYAGARSNPEVVAPLDKLRGMLEPVQSTPVIIGGDVRLRGSDLVIALRNETRVGAASGRRSGIR